MPAKRGAHIHRHQQQSHDVAVLGGGVAGLAVAWRARLRGLRVVVLDRGDLGAAASSVAAGMLAPVTEADPGERALLELGLQSARRWPAFADELRELTGIDVGHVACGTLVVARDRDEAEALERELELRERLGLEAERLLPSAARRLEPALAPALRLAIDVPGDHAVDPRLLVAALARAAESAGAVLRPGSAVERVEHDGGRVTGVVLAGGERVTAAQVVVAAGAWSGALDGLPEEARVPIRPVKGQTLRLRDRAGAGLLTRVVRWGPPTPGYLVPRGDGRYVLGATMEERGYDLSVTAGGIYELLRDATELVPGIAELEITELRAGLRPGAPGNAPLVGPADGTERLLLATGHFRNGILLAPVTAERIAGLLPAAVHA